MFGLVSRVHAVSSHIQDDRVAEKICWFGPELANTQQFGVRLTYL